MEIWPNFFIVGASRSGTTSLYEYLRSVTGIYMSPVKETHYFSRRVHPVGVRFRQMIWDKKQYLKLFKGVKDEKIIGEASPLYLRDPDAPKLIHEVSPNAKILISLRNPIDRQFSGYLFGRQLGRIPYSFKEQIESLKKIGCKTGETIPDKYAQGVKRYLDIFGPKQVKIIIFEEWVKDIPKTLIDIIEFLGIKHANLNFELKTFNPYFNSTWIGKFMFGSPKILKLIRLALSKSKRDYLVKKI